MAVWNVRPRRGRPNRAEHRGAASQESGGMDQSNSSLGVEELLAHYAGAGLDDLKDWNEKNLRRIAEQFERRDFDAIREDYDAGVYDDLLWPADEDEAEFLARFQQAL